MKQLLIVDPVGEKAGMDYYDIFLAKGLVNSGAKVFLLSNFIFTEPGIISRKVFNNKAGNIFQKAFNFFFGHFRAILFAYSKGIKNILFHNFSAGIREFIVCGFAKFTNRNVIIIAHDISSFVNADIPFFKKVIYTWIADTIVVHNSFSYDALVSQIGEAISSKTKIIKHGSFLHLPKAEVTRSKARFQLGLSNDDKYLLFFGQIKRVKGLDILLHALSKTKEPFKLLIAGKPWKDDFQYYIDIIEQHQLSDRIHSMIHFIDDDTRELLFKAVDGLVIPYKEIYQSGVLLMAMSYQIPIIASDLGPNKDLIQDSINGLLFKSEDVDSLAYQINKLMLDNSLAESIKANSLATLQGEYDWENIAGKYLDILI